VAGQRLNRKRDVPDFDLCVTAPLREIQKQARNTARTTGELSQSASQKAIRALNIRHHSGTPSPLSNSATFQAATKEQS
jgi:hypothetical protein